MSQADTQTKKPVKTFRAGGVSASIWRNEAEQDGQTVVRHSIRIQKRYRNDEDGDWHNTDYLFPNDLPRLILVAQKALEFAVLHESDDEDLPI